MRRLRWMAAGGSVGLAIAVGAGLADAAAKPSAAKKRDAVGLGIGYRTPDFSATDLQGQPQSLASYKGSVLVLHFWASWCPYCRGEIPELTQLSQGEWTSKGVRVLTVSTDQELPTIQQFVAQSRLPYPVIADIQTDFSASDQYAISGIPVTYVIGRNGHIVSRLNGAGDITAEVRKALAAPAA